MSDGRINPIGGALEISQPFNPYKLFTGVFVPDALVRASQISAGAKLAYGRLSRYAGADGDCHPSVKALALELGLKERQAQRHLSELQAGGLIRSFPRFKAPSVRDTNGYVFLWHQMFAGSTRSPVSDLTPPLVSRTTPPPGVTCDTTPGVTCDTTPRAVHLYAIDLLRWAAGEPGTRFGKWLNQPNSKVMEIDKGAKV
jgi:hypothetical protein